MPSSWPLELVEPRRCAEDRDVVAGRGCTGRDGDRADGRWHRAWNRNREIARPDARARIELRIDALDLDRVAAGRHGHLVEADQAGVLRARGRTVSRRRVRDRVRATGAEPEPGYDRSGKPAGLTAACV